MKVLTIRNPWAYAIFHLGKDVENRSWYPRELRADIPSGRWVYDSFAFIENRHDWDSGVRVGRASRVCILIRRRAWIDALMNVCGDSILDEGTFARGDEKDMQPAQVGQCLEAHLDGTAEQDIAELLEEVRRLETKITRWRLEDQ